MTLPQEVFDVIERAAVSKPPQRVVNPRFVLNVIAVNRSLSTLAVVKGGASTMISLLECEDSRRPVLRGAYRSHTYRYYIAIYLPRYNEKLCLFTVFGRGSASRTFS